MKGEADYQKCGGPFIIVNMTIFFIKDIFYWLHRELA